MHVGGYDQLTLEAVIERAAMKHEERGGFAGRVWLVEGSGAGAT